MIKKRIKKVIFSKLNFEKRVADEVSKAMKKNGFSPISEYRDDDIFIAGYPKSGNTWMQNLIAGALYGIDTTLLPDKLTQELVPDVHGKKYIKRFGEKTFFKTHELPKPHMKNVIHLVRDGRDAIASYYAMNKSMGIDCTLEDMIIHEKFVSPSSWHIHTKSWIENPFKARLLVVKYEDLKKDASKELHRVLDFAGISRKQEIIDNSVNGNSFKSMQKKESVFGWNNAKWDPNEKFIRKGKVGSYEEEIPKELIAHFDKISKIELNYFNYV